MLKPFKTQTAVFIVETRQNVFFASVKFAGFSEKSRFGLGCILIGIDSNLVDLHGRDFKIVWWPKEQELDHQTGFEVGRQVLLLALADVGIPPEQIIGFSRLREGDVQFWG